MNDPVTSGVGNGLNINNVSPPQNDEDEMVVLDHHHHHHSDDLLGNSPHREDSNSGATIIASSQSTEATLSSELQQLLFSAPTSQQPLLMVPGSDNSHAASLIIDCPLHADPCLSATANAAAVDDEEQPNFEYDELETTLVQQQQQQPPPLEVSFFDNDDDADYDEILQAPTIPTQNAEVSSSKMVRAVDMDSSVSFSPMHQPLLAPLIEGIRHWLIWLDGDDDHSGEELGPAVQQEKKDKNSSMELGQNDLQFCTRCWMFLGKPAASGTLFELHSELLYGHQKFVIAVSEDIFCNEDKLVLLAERCHRYSQFTKKLQIPSGLPVRHFATLIDYKVQHGYSVQLVAERNGLCSSSGKKEEYEQWEEGGGMLRRIIKHIQLQEDKICGGQEALAAAYRYYQEDSSVGPYSCSEVRDHFSSTYSNEDNYSDSKEGQYYRKQRQLARQQPQMQSPPPPLPLFSNLTTTNNFNTVNRIRKPAPTPFYKQTTLSFKRKLLAPPLLPTRTADQAPESRTTQPPNSSQPVPEGWGNNEEVKEGQLLPSERWAANSQASSMFCWNNQSSSSSCNDSNDSYRSATFNPWKSNSSGSGTSGAAKGRQSRYNESTREATTTTTPSHSLLQSIHLADSLRKQKRDSLLLARRKKLQVKKQ